MREISEAGQRLVDALIKAPVAWQSPLQLAGAIGWGLEETTNLLAILDASGWLSAWERESDVVVTLSVEGASLLGLRLVESGRDETPRWAGQGDPEPPLLRASGVFRDERAAMLERVVDPSSTAEENLVRAEETLIRHAIPSDPRVKALIESLPLPTLLIGVGLSPWPGPNVSLKSSCPSCGSRHLQPSMYCLYCDRWGLDHLLLTEGSATPKPLAEPRDDSKRREFERQTRKGRRKSRLQAKTEAERASKRSKRRA